MYIPLKETLNKYGITLKGVIQIGCHWAQEHEELVNCGIERFVYIEPCKEAWNKLVEKFNSIDKGEFCTEILGTEAEHIRGFSDINIRGFNMACGSKEEEMTMYVSHQNQGMSNSLLKPEGHLIQHPNIIFDDAEVVKVIPLDHLPIDKIQYDFLFMDCQGYEGEVLKGATETLKHINIIMTECNRGQTYHGNMEIEEMDLFLAGHGFSRVETFWPSPYLSWGDTVYIRVQQIGTP